MLGFSSLIRDTPQRFASSLSEAYASFLAKLSAFACESSNSLRSPRYEVYCRRQHAARRAIMYQKSTD